jgi:hypothetical protein
MEYVKITKTEYEKLLRYREIVNYIEETVHEELNVKPLKDKRAIKVIKNLDQEIKEGKRKVISEQEFESRYGHLKS